ncbi:uncharacterized protein [Palaemon carinicauda]|uniref:uncharacterized protein n=1 Tax=Palaemon carinicauda TaxID=392227 RepID=UPI0035B57794
MENVTTKPILIPALLVLMELIVLFSRAEGRPYVLVVPGHSILPEHLYLNFTDVKTVCNCKEMALSIPGCTGATAYDRGNGVIDCLLSNKVLLGYFDMIKDPSAITIRRKEAPKCVDPFMLTEVGCIMLLKELAFYADCRKKCQDRDADLAVMETSSDQVKLWDILKRVYQQSDIFYFWVGIENSKWLTGVPVTGFVFSTSWGTIQLNGAIGERKVLEGLYCVCQRHIYE